MLGPFASMSTHELWLELDDEMDRRGDMTLLVLRRCEQRMMKHLKRETGAMFEDFEFQIWSIFAAIQDHRLREILDDKIFKGQSMTLIYWIRSTITIL